MRFDADQINNEGLFSSGNDYIDAMNLEDPVFK